jgi:hypothetical protein
MNLTILKYCSRGIFLFFFLSSSLFASGQTESKWWKRDVQEEADLTIVDSLIITDTIKKYPFYVSPVKGTLTVHADSAINAIDSIWMTEEKILNGYRIQIHFGTLESSRKERAKCRKEMGIDQIYLESIAPNYTVAIGDYRTRWEAETALRELKGAYPDALLVPAEINLPDLD